MEFSLESSRFQGFIENSCTAVRSNVVNEGFTKGRQSGLSLVACISSDELLGSNLLASPSLRAGSPHELALVKHGLSAADGLNLGIERASHPWVVCLHQDVFLPQGWDRQLQRQLETATRQFGPIGVAGTYGVSAPREVQPESEATDTLSDGAGQRHVNSAKFAVNRIGRVIHRGQTLFDGPEPPARVATLDELLLVVPRDAPLRLLIGPRVPSLRSRHLPSGPGTRASRGRSERRMPPQYADDRAAQGVLPQRGRIRREMGAQAARGNALRRHRSAAASVGARQCAGATTKSEAQAGRARSE